MAVPAHLKIARWIVDHLLWDNTRAAGKGFWGRLRPAWKLVVAFLGAGLLTWSEWVEHHPPEIAVVALIHFVFVLVVIALVVHTVQWYNRTNKKSASGPSRSRGE